MKVADIESNLCKAVVVHQFFNVNFRESLLWDITETIHRHGYSLHCCTQSALDVILAKLVSVLAISV